MSLEKNKYLFEKFEIIETLKKDEFTSVYLANHIFLGKKIILKTLDSTNLSDPTILERFKREAKILAQLDHPNIIKVLDFGMFKDFFYISFEHFESRNLRSVLKSNELSFEQKSSLFVQMLKGLNYAHQNSIIHRDIKPENILINSNLNLKIADFGLALAGEENLVTSKSSIVGTPSYMSPEQIRGDKLTNQSDLFSVGIAAYELFTGTNPFIGNDINSTINKILNFKEENLENGLKELPENIHLAVASLMKRNQKLRASSAEDILRELGIKFDSPVKSISTSEIFTKKRLVTVISVIGLLAIVFLIYSMSNNLISNKPNNENEKSVSDNLPIQPIDSEGKKTNEPTDVPTQTENKIGPKISVEDKKTPDSKTSEPAELKSIASNIPGKLTIECFPWAEVFINGKKADSTPLEEPLRFLPGEYEVKLVHPDFPPFIKKIEIKPDEFQFLEVNFLKLFGFLDCLVHPWGEVSIDGNSIGQTPFRKPAALKPGKHTLLISNPNYDVHENEIYVKNGDTLIYRFNFNQK
ncbi:MAG: protein kinase [Bacteroidetes bacterium]|nr:protein kinase [Bacteroidota bacterium]